ncbi:Urea carboxylase [[Candida] zeylanoides]
MNFEKIKRVLVANRGEISCRVIRSCQSLKLTAVAIFSKEDAGSAHVSAADEAVVLSGTGAAAYIDSEQIVKVAIDNNCDAVVPGYGFLSENSAFAKELEKQGIVFVGPSSNSILTFGLKHTARDLAVASGVPIAPGSDLLQDFSEAAKFAHDIGYPVILKATAGGGGMGLKSLFKNAGAFVEKYVENGRHIEVQVFGNGLGQAVTFGERECSIQRRHQKVIEEAPSPFISLSAYNTPNLRRDLCAAAAKLAATSNYKSAGTIEFLVDDDTGSFYFLEMNTRLQVEHGITELTHGVDLVNMMLLQAEYEARDQGGIPADILDGFAPSAIPHGHAIECRIYAENPAKDFAPCPGVLTNVVLPESHSYTMRVDHWIATGTKISPYFDPLLAKLMVWADSRDLAIEGMIQALTEIKIQGPVTNVDYLLHILLSEQFQHGNTLTSFLDKTFTYKPKLMEFIESGPYTTIQDLPGRVATAGGVPLSGPVDPLSLQIANAIVGNQPGCEGLEMNLMGPTILFHAAATIAITGSNFEPKVDGKPVPTYTAISIPRGGILSFGSSIDAGSKAYLAILGGFPGVATYLGSKACTPTLSLGGHQGRVILPGDCLDIAPHEKVEKVQLGYSLPQRSKPQLVRPDGPWQIRVISGPHDTPEICSPEGLKELYSFEYKVNLNSNRGATRLDGPGMRFSRQTGGDGGTHPSNILEYPYPTGGISAVGSDMVLFGVDGATLSGFICVSVPVSADWWNFRQAGESMIVVDYGTDSFSLMNTGRLHAFNIALKDSADVVLKRAIVRSEVTTGAIGFTFDSSVMPRDQLLQALISLEKNIPGPETLKVPSRIYRIPIAFDHSSLRHCVERYMKSQRPHAPYLPNNTKFVMKASCINSVDKFKKAITGTPGVVTAVSFLCANTLLVHPDPRMRFMTPKYNPARMFTPKGAVGTGAVSQSIYSIDSPGGYMIWGMTLPDICWNTFGNIKIFQGKPWFLQNFDQIQFYEVTEPELDELNNSLIAGKLEIDFRDTEFDFAQYIEFYNSVIEEAQQIRQLQREANARLAQEEATSLQQWTEEKQRALSSGVRTTAIVDDPRNVKVASPMAANVYKINVRKGDIVKGNDVLTILEAMKMEIPVKPKGDATYEVLEVFISEGDILGPGDLMMLLKEAE